MFLEMGLRANNLISVLLTKIAEIILIETPIANVAANPCTIVAPNCSENQYRIPQVIRVETLPSLIAGQALLKPVLIDVSKVLPILSSSFIRSKIKILASTAMPIVNTMPAMPGSVKVAPIVPNIDIIKNKLAIREIFAKNPKGFKEDSPVLMAYRSFAAIPKNTEFSLVIHWSIGFLGLSTNIDDHYTGGEQLRKAGPTLNILGTTVSQPYL